MAIPIIAPAVPRPSLFGPSPSMEALKPDTAQPAGAAGFSDLLNSAISTVEQAQNKAHKASEDLLISGKGDIHEVALISQRAELSMELFQQVRNKLVQSYQEIMRMPM